MFPFSECGATLPPSLIGWQEDVTLSISQHLQTDEPQDGMLDPLGRTCILCCVGPAS